VPKFERAHTDTDTGIGFHRDKMIAASVPPYVVGVDNKAKMLKLLSGEMNFYGRPL